MVKIKSKGVYQNHLKKLKRKANLLRENEVVIAIIGTTLFWLGFFCLFVDTTCR